MLVDLDLVTALLRFGTGALGSALGGGALARDGFVVLGLSGTSGSPRGARRKRLEWRIACISTDQLYKFQVN